MEQWLSCCRQLNHWDMMLEYGKVRVAAHTPHSLRAVAALRISLYDSVVLLSHVCPTDRPAVCSQTTEQMEVVVDCLWRLSDWTQLKEHLSSSAVLKGGAMEDSPALLMTRAYLALQEGHVQEVRAAGGHRPRKDTGTLCQPHEVNEKAAWLASGACLRIMIFLLLHSFAPPGRHADQQGAAVCAAPLVGAAGAAQPHLPCGAAADLPAAGGAQGGGERGSDWAHLNGAIRLLCAASRRSRASPICQQPMEKCVRCA